MPPRLTNKAAQLYGWLTTYYNRAATDTANFEEAALAQQIEAVRAQIPERFEVESSTDPFQTGDPDRAREHWIRAFEYCQEVRPKYALLPIRETLERGLVTYRQELRFLGDRAVDPIVDAIGAAVSGRAFHATTDTSFEGILASGAIEPNEHASRRPGDVDDGSQLMLLRNPSSNRSHRSYAARHRYVSMFQPSLSVAELREIPEYWSLQHPATERSDSSHNVIVALAMKREHEGQLIREDHNKIWGQAPKDGFFCMKYECWFPGRIPLSFLEFAYVLMTTRLNR